MNIAGRNGMPGHTTSAGRAVWLRMLLAWSPNPYVALSAELGRERAAAPPGTAAGAAVGTGSTSVNFAALRLVARTDWLSGGK